MCLTNNKKLRNLLKIISLEFKELREKIYKS